MLGLYICTGFPWLVSEDHSSCGAWVSPCGGFSCFRAQALGCSGFRSCGSRALEHRLRSCGARAWLLRGLWDLPGPGVKSMSAPLALGILIHGASRGASVMMTQWTWVWVNSGSWWWTGRPGVQRSMGSQRIGQLSDWTTRFQHRGVCCRCPAKTQTSDRRDTEGVQLRSHRMSLAWRWLRLATARAPVLRKRRPWEQEAVITGCLTVWFERGGAGPRARMSPGDLPAWAEAVTVGRMVTRTKWQMI